MNLTSSVIRPPRSPSVLEHKYNISTLYLYNPYLHPARLDKSFDGALGLVEREPLVAGTDLPDQLAGLHFADLLVIAPQNLRGEQADVLQLEKHSYNITQCGFF